MEVNQKKKGKKDQTPDSENESSVRSDMWIESDSDDANITVKQQKMKEFSRIKEVIEYTIYQRQV